MERNVKAPITTTQRTPAINEYRKGNLEVIPAIEGLTVRELVLNPRRCGGSNETKARQPVYYNRLWLCLVRGGNGKYGMRVAVICDGRRKYGLRRYL